MAIHLLLEGKSGCPYGKQTTPFSSQRRSDRLINSSTNLLDISRIDSGRLQMDCQDTYCTIPGSDAVGAFPAGRLRMAASKEDAAFDDLPMVCADSTQVRPCFFQSAITMPSPVLTAPGRQSHASAAYHEEPDAFCA